MSQPFATCTAGDPKFWPAWLRYLILADISLFVFLGNMYAAGISTGFGVLAEEFHVGFDVLVDTISYPVLALGVGNLIWTPISICFGKRPTIIISAMLFLGCCIWTIEAKSFDSLVASRVMGCFAAGSIESIGPAIVADLFMERYFSTSIAIFSLSLAAGSQFGPLVAGYVIRAKGWRWFFILCAIIIAANLLFMVFFLPETNYKRVFVNGETAADVDKQTLQIVEHLENGGEKGAEATGLERIPTQARMQYDGYAGSYWKDLIHFRNRGLEDGLGAWPKQFSMPFRFLLVPHAFFAMACYGVFLGGTVLTSTINPSLLMPPPYLFTAANLGVFAVSSFTGILIAYPIAGPLTDMLSRAVTRARNGVHYPENRLPALIVPFLICPLGLILYAYTFAQKGSYVSAGVGQSMQVAAMVLVPSAVLSVVVDAYPKGGGDAMVMINAGKNLIAFGITLGSTDWIMNEGLVNMFWEMAAVQWAVLLFAFPLFFCGVWLRSKTLWIV